MRHRLGWVAAVAMGLASWSSSAAAQACVATLPQPPHGWTTLPLPAAKKPLLKGALALHCQDCAPQLWVEVATGPATASMRAGPKGAAWAQQVSTVPGARTEALAGLLTSARAGNPECTVQGEIEGVTTVTDASFVAMRARLKCLPADNETTILSYAAFDGNCLNDVAVVWKSAADLSPQTMNRVHDLLARLTFGP